jgi:hypothetical protein
MGYAVGSTLSVTAQEVADAAGCGLDDTSAFLRLFSVGFDTNELRGDQGDIERIRDRPVLTDGANNYLCYSPHNLLWGLRPRLEHALKAAGANVFKRYQRHRSRTVESRAVAALTRALRPDWIHREISYETTENGHLKRPEI